MKVKGLNDTGRLIEGYLYTTKYETFILDNKGDLNRINLPNITLFSGYYMDAKELYIGDIIQMEGRKFIVLHSPIDVYLSLGDYLTRKEVMRYYYSGGNTIESQGEVVGNIFIDEGGE